MKDTSTRLQLKVTDEVYKLLENEAKPYGKTVTSWVQYLILNHLDNAQKQNNK